VGRQEGSHVASSGPDPRDRGGVILSGEEHMNQKQIAAEQVQYTGNGTAGRQDMTAPTGFWITGETKPKLTILRS
jgi:hypothetical protein